ncbi:MAG: class II glutamine amidotransferase [Thermodesulfobacteriota bacterium]
MCELFAMSGSQRYTAQEYLPPFADRSRGNISGWGIGFFRDGQVVIEKSHEEVFSGDQIHDSFNRLARVIDSRIILSHIRCPKSGHQKESHAQPLADEFLDHHWLFIFTGESSNLLAYRSPRPLMREHLLAARVFEFVRDGLESGLAHQPRQSLYQVLARTCKRMIAQYPGKYMFFLANETVLLAFHNHSQVLTYQNPKTPGDLLILTTVTGGLTSHPDNWCSFSQQDPQRGQILIISGADLLYLGHL